MYYYVSKIILTIFMCATVNSYKSDKNHLSWRGLTKISFFDVPRTSGRMQPATATALLSYPPALTRHDRSTAVFASSPNTRRKSSNRTSNSYSSIPKICHGVFLSVSQKVASGTAKTRMLSYNDSAAVVLDTISSPESFYNLRKRGEIDNSYVYLKSLQALSKISDTVFVP